MTAILVVEDDPSIRLGLEDTLTAKGYAVEVVGRGADAVERANSGRYDLIQIAMPREERTYRLQVWVSDDEERAIEDFRFRVRLPSRAAAIRELLRRGLALARQENSN